MEISSLFVWIEFLELFLHGGIVFRGKLIHFIRMSKFYMEPDPAWASGFS
jgi:hypothetical protein